MNVMRRPRFVVPAATAVMITFGRNGLLPFEGYYGPLDQILNLFVVVVAPFFAFKGLYPRALNRNLSLLWPFLFLASWVCACVLFGSTPENWPSTTALITIVLSVVFASQITGAELTRVRRSVLFLTALFNIYALMYAQSSIQLILSGMLETRLGMDISPSNVIIFPRIMYMLIVTCLFSIVIERKLWAKFGAAAILILPMLIALSTGGRGPLLGFAVSSLLLVFGVSGTRRSLTAFLGAVSLTALAYISITQLFPTMLHRISDRREDERLDIWSNLLHLDNVSLFGSGVGPTYPHNVFLEFFFVFGIVGFLLFLWFLVVVCKTMYRSYRDSNDIEVLWVIALVVLQLAAQQLSLDIFYGTFWGVLVLPLGACWQQFSRANQWVASPSTSATVEDL